MHALGITMNRLGRFVVLGAWVLPRFAMAAGDCNQQCSLDEMQDFWGDCCCVSCWKGRYLDLPEGISAEDPLPWWTCCHFARPYLGYVFKSIFLFMFYCNVWFWYYGHAFRPTSVVELSKAEGTEGLEDVGPKTTLSGRVVRHVSLHSKDDPQSLEERDLEPSLEIDCEYYCKVFVFSREDVINPDPIVIPLKSLDAYHKLQEYCNARDGEWWKTTTTDKSNPTNGYHLMVLGTDDNALLMYRRYLYHPRWKTEILFSGLFSLLETIVFFMDVPTLPHILFVDFVLLTNISILWFANFWFSVFGYHGKGGRRNQTGLQNSSQNDYVEMRTNPGPTPVV